MTNDINSGTPHKRTLGELFRGLLAEFTGRASKPAPASNSNLLAKGFNMYSRGPTPQELEDIRIRKERWKALHPHARSENDRPQNFSVPN